MQLIMEMTPQGLINNIKQAREHSISIGKQEKELDQKVMDLMHVLEYYPLNAVQLTKVAKELRETKKIRRQLKEERCQWQSVFSHIKESNVVNNTAERQVRYLNESIASYNKWIGGK